jgi:hypothetical protein
MNKPNRNTVGKSSMPHIFTFDRLVVVGEFLAEGYNSTPNISSMAEGLKEVVANWDTYVEILLENRVYENFVALVVESNELFQVLDVEFKNEFKVAYMDNWRRNELIKRQLAEMASVLGERLKGSVLLLKGGVRLFDDLYPTVGHRFMADIDTYFENPEVLNALARNGYQSEHQDIFDLANSDTTFLNWYKKQNHHLPPIKKETHPCWVEMHQSMVHLRAIKLLPECIFDKSVQLKEIPIFQVPTLVDQLILNILHSKYGEKYTNNAKYRLRNVLEGYLLFLRLSNEERMGFYTHFEKINKSTDIAFWEALCQHFLNAKEFGKPQGIKLRFKIWLHLKFGQNPRVNAMGYTIYFIYRFLFRDIWSRHGRLVLARKMGDADKRQGFFVKLTTFFRL